LQEILQYLKKNPGERLDADIAKATGIALSEVRRAVSELSNAGEVMTCRYTRYDGGEKTEGWVCRVSGYIPQPAPGRKPAQR
jgi:DNA-binding IclR family transcriptional regulator